MAQAVVSTWAQTSGKMASFSETLDLAEEEEMLYLISFQRRVRQWRKRLSIKKKKRGREE